MRYLPLNLQLFPYRWCPPSSVSHSYRLEHSVVWQLNPIGPGQRRDDPLACVCDGHGCAETKCFSFMGYPNNNNDLLVFFSHTPTQVCDWLIHSFVSRQCPLRMWTWILVSFGLLHERCSMVIYKGTSGNMTACAQDFEKRKIELTVNLFSGFIL